MKNKVDKDNENKKIFFVCPMRDDQTGLYMRNAFVQKNCPVAIFDNKEESKMGFDYLNEKLIADVKKLTPDLVLIVKGLGITKETIIELKKTSKVFYWMLDHTLGGKPIVEYKKYLDAIQEADIYYTVVRGDIKELKEHGINAKLLLEAASPQFNYLFPLNYLEEKKFGSDITFCGSIGTEGYHEDRLAWLDSIAQAGNQLKIYGDIPNKEIVPQKLLSLHTNVSAINEIHNLVVCGSKINLGRSGWPEVDLAMSARTYRVLASGGFHLTNHTKGIEDLFTPGVHLATYTSRLDCLKKIKYYLAHPEEREKIALAGMKEVLAKHTFHHRVDEILRDLK